MDARPALTVVIPSLDDTRALGELLSDLERQQGLSLQVVVVAGGPHPVPGPSPSLAGGSAVVRLESPPGRGTQMNAGAARAAGADLLFLHADTRLDDPLLLQRAARHLERVRCDRGCDRVAGHFPLRFRTASPRRSFAFSFFEAKTRLNRPDCVNGDQGFWLSARWFGELGGFDESLPFLEDARLAARVSAQGGWTLLPGLVSTSARRFEAEGLFERQTVNALVRAFEALGEPAFVAEARGLYRAQAETERLELLPFFAAACRVMGQGPRSQWVRRWLGAGRYACRQVWQVLLWGELVVRLVLSAPVCGDALWGRSVYETQRWSWFESKLAGALGAAAAFVWLHGVLAALRWRANRPG